MRRQEFLEVVEHRGAKRALCCCLAAEQWNRSFVRAVWFRRLARDYERLAINLAGYLIHFLAQFHLSKNS